MIPQVIALVARAKALIARLRAFIDFLQKVQSLWQMLGSSPAPAPRRASSSGGSYTVAVRFHLERFAINPAGMRMLLQSEEVGRVLESAARAVAPSDMTVSRVVGRTRQNVRITDDAWDAMSREAQTGHLSRLLGQIRV